MQFKYPWPARKWKQQQVNFFLNMRCVKMSEQRPWTICHIAHARLQIHEFYICTCINIYKSFFVTKSYRPTSNTTFWYDLLHAHMIIRYFYSSTNLKIKSTPPPQMPFELLPEHRFIPEFTHFSHVIWILFEPSILPVQTISWWNQ